MLARCCGCSPLSDILRCRKQHIIHLVGDSTEVLVLSASKRRSIIKFRDQHYPGGHRSWISTETTSTRSFLRCYFSDVTTGCAPGNPSTGARWSGSIQKD